MAATVPSKACHSAFCRRPHFDISSNDEASKYSPRFEKAHDETGTEECLPGSNAYTVHCPERDTWLPDRRILHYARQQGRRLDTLDGGPTRLCCSRRASLLRKTLSIAIDRSAIRTE